MADTPIDLLIVDDNPDDCFRYQRLLERAHPGSYGIRVAGSGREGLQACRERCPTALLLDYLLPDMDGIDFLENLRDPSLLGESMEPLVIVSTGQGSEEIAVRCLKLGAYDYLVKENLTGQELHRTIRAGLIQRDLERRLREKQDELESFAFVAAHDLRAPLQKISSFCEILEMRSDGADPETADILTRIVRSTTRMRRLVDDLLAYARVGRFSVQSSVPLDEVASTALSNLEELIRRSAANVRIDPCPKWKVMRPRS
ncbi:MAG: response regulator [Candidatus Eisenbacteria bacterium]